MASKRKIVAQEREILLQYRVKLFREIKKAEGKTLIEIKRIINSVKDADNIEEAAISKLNRSSRMTVIANQMEETNLTLSAAMIRDKNKLYGLRLSNARIRRQVASSVDLSLFKNLHNANVAAIKKMSSEIKRAIVSGESMHKTATKLLKIERPTVIIPKHIKRMRAAAKAAIADPKDYKIFKGVIKGVEKRINNLTRAGEEGFQHLGIRGSTRTLKKQLEREVAKLGTASTKNVDAIIEAWARRKALYYQKTVVRNEVIKAFNKYHSTYMRDADHIDGVTWRLSGSHPDFDICDSLVGDYYYVDGTPPEPIVDSHVNCLCYTIPILAADALRLAA